jgi:Lar family restriction alleviation protein
MKPCPFCGGPAAFLVQASDDIEPFNLYGTYCCGTPDCLMEEGVPDQHDTPEDAAEKWNKRV